jgi:predicted GIY-YIG superfamily endonuclease
VGARPHWKKPCVNALFFFKVQQQNMSVVYCLVTPDERYTYVGATKNLARRLRQHNAEIKGGAKYTKRCKSWRVLFYIEGFANSHEGWRETLSCEWHLKHVSRYRRGTSPVARRERNVATLLNRDRWSHLRKVVVQKIATPQQMGVSWSTSENSSNTSSNTLSENFTTECITECTGGRRADQSDTDDTSSERSERSVASALPAEEIAERR